MSETGGFSKSDQKWMEHAISLAHRAQAEGEVPIGAVVVRDGELTGEGWNRNISLNDPSAHAEIMALRDAGRNLQNHRLPDCTMYVTLEPCAMCVGAMIHARLERVFFGTPDPKTGALGGAYSLPASHSHNHRIDVSGGLMADEISELLRSFFRLRRQGKTKTQSSI
jgi:tRNA(adenine34) deaminase